MSQHQFFKRTAVSPQLAQQLRTVTLPAPTRGLVLNENESFIQPGAALVLDNWKPTMKGLALRGGCTLWKDLFDTTPAPWANNKVYTNLPTGHGSQVTDTNDNTYWQCQVQHISAASGTFAADRAAHPTYWASISKPPPLPDNAIEAVVSMFQYASGNNQRIYAATRHWLFDATAPQSNVVRFTQNSGNYVASQLANQGGDYMLILNDAGDFPMRFNGTTWTTLDATPTPYWANSTAYFISDRRRDITDNSRWICAVAHTSAATGTFAADRAAHGANWKSDAQAEDGASWITGPPGTTVEAGHNLTYVWKYRGRWFFIEGGSMNAWYLPTNSVGGVLSMIPLSGAATKGGKLIAGFSWSLDAGDGIDDKCVFMTDQGELLIFTGSDPSTIANWRQEGRYATSPPLGMNAWTQIGGDVLIATVDGIIPISASITKDSSQLALAAITRPIKSMWRDEVAAKRQLPWTMCKWDEYGGLFVTWPGGAAGSQYCAVVNVETGAWARFTGWDAMAFARMRGDMFFGTQRGLVMQADRTGMDNGLPYTATMVGGWEMFSSQSTTMVWRQARAAFAARAGEPFQPQISATTDYVIVIPPAPNAAPDPGSLDVWDQGLWASTPPDPEPTFQAKWDAAVPQTPTVRSTGWVSVGMTGFSHAPIVQVTVAQKALPTVELISIAATFEPCGVNI